MWGISCIFIRISLEIKLSSVCVTWKRRVDQLFDQHANLQKMENLITSFVYEELENKWNIRKNKCKKYEKLINDIC